MALTKQVADLRSQLSLQKKQAEEKIQSLTRELQEVEHKGLLTGMAGCREQILLTPVGQQFLFLLKDELIKDFCKSSHLLDTLGDAIYTLLEVGRKFALDKLSTADPTLKEDLKELVMKAPDLSKILGIDEIIPWEGPWWLDTFKRAFEVFTRGSFSDPSFPAWGVLPIPLAPCPGEMLSFDELDQKMMEVDPNSSPERTPSDDYLSLVDPGQDGKVADDPRTSSPMPGANEGNVGEQEEPDVAPSTHDQP